MNRTELLKRTCAYFDNLFTLDRKMIESDDDLSIKPPRILPFSKKSTYRVLAYFMINHRAFGAKEIIGALAEAGYKVKQPEVVDAVKKLGELEWLYSDPAYFRDVPKRRTGTPSNEYIFIADSEEISDLFNDSLESHKIELYEKLASLKNIFGY